MAPNIDVGDRLLDLGHMTANAFVARRASRMMRVRFDRRCVRPIRRLRTVTGETHDTRRLQKIGIVLGPVDVVAAETGDAARVHNARHKIVALHAILVPGAVREMRESCLTELVFFQLPEILQIQAHMESNRPVIILPFDRALWGLALGVALASMAGLPTALYSQAVSPPQGLTATYVGSTA
jgi:hypothetical protein